jgi:hypothetical protein
MKRSWKTPRPVPVEYRNTYSNNLFGTFEVGRLDAFVSLAVDLSSNLRAANKQQNNYEVACDLVVSHLDLKSAQLPEDVVESFAALCKETPEAARKLRIILGKQIFDYPIVRVERSNVGNFFVTALDASAGGK